MKAETILEKYFPLVIVDEDEWAIHVVKAMHEFSKQENKELIETNNGLKIQSRALSDAVNELQLDLEKLQANGN